MSPAESGSGPVILRATAPQDLKGEPAVSSAPLGASEWSTGSSPAGYAVAVIVAAGRGRRLGAPDKVFLPLGGRPILAYALDAAERATAVRDVILVVGEHTRATADDLVLSGPYDKVLAIVTGGEQRQHSVAAGVAAVPADTEVVIVHDAARPLAPPALFDRCAAAALGTGAAIAAIPVADTLKRVAAGRVVGTVPRDGLWAAQTPQAFRRALLQDALDRLAATSDVMTPPFTDEAALFEWLGLSVEVVVGAVTNLKVTRRDDLPVVEALVAHALTAPPPEP